MRAVSIATIIAALGLWVTASASARDYPFCAYGGKTSEGVRCDYSTLAQCQASTAGGGGSCIGNPRVAQPRAQDAGPAGRR